MRPSRPPAAAMRVPMDDGARIAVFVYAPEGVTDGPGTPFGVTGDKDPVLMLHGNGEEHGIFGPLADAACEAGHSVIALDSRAQGKSTRGDASLSYELMAADALECLSRLGVSQAHVVGFSDGAIEGLLLARDHPLRVLSLFAMGANLTPEGVVELDGWDMSADMRRLTRWAAWVRGLPKDAPIEPELLSPTPDEAGRAAELLQLMRDEPHIAAASLASIACPTCIAAGEFDCIRREETRAIYEGIRMGGNKNVSLEIIPDVGHNLPKQAPQLVSSLMLGTIARAQGH